MAAPVALEGGERGVHVASNMCEGVNLLLAMVARGVDLLLAVVAREV